MCACHNAYMAELDYGKEKMDQYRVCEPSPAFQLFPDGVERSSGAFAGSAFAGGESEESFLPQRSYRFHETSGCDVHDFPDRREVCLPIDARQQRPFPGAELERFGDREFVAPERDEIERIVFLIRGIVEAENANGDEAEYDASGFENIGLELVDDVSDRSSTVH